MLFKISSILVREDTQKNMSIWPSIFENFLVIPPPLLRPLWFIFFFFFDNFPYIFLSFSLLEVSMIKNLYTYLCARILKFNNSMYIIRRRWQWCFDTLGGSWWVECPRLLPGPRGEEGRGEPCLQGGRVCLWTHQQHQATRPKLFR